MKLKRAHLAETQNPGQRVAINAACRAAETTNKPMNYSRLMRPPAAIANARYKSLADSSDKKAMVFYPPENANWRCKLHTFILVESSTVNGAANLFRLVSCRTDFPG